MNLAKSILLILSTLLPLVACADELKIAPAPQAENMSAPAGILKSALACSTVDQCIDAAVLAASRDDQAAMSYAMGRIYLFEKPAAVMPGRAVSTAQKGLDKLDAGREREAIDLLNEAVGDDPANDVIQQNLALILLHVGEYVPAERALRAALAIKPWNASAWEGMARAYNGQNKPDLALASLMIAYEWSGDKSACLTAFRKMATTSAKSGAGTMYRRATETIEQLEAAEAGVDKNKLYLGGTVEALDPTLPGKVPGKNCVKPVYPASALALKQTGSTVVKFILASNGYVVRTKIDKSSGYIDLDSVSRLAVANCRFTKGAKMAWYPLQYVWEIP